MSQQRRARTADDKLQRRDDILAVARALVAERTVAEVTMTHVAERAGVVKGTLYLYFPTREALFLALVERELGDWFDEVDAALAALAALAPLDAACDAVATLVADATARRPVLAELLAALHRVLEHNVDESTARAFKHFLLRRTTTTGEGLERVLPFLDRTQGPRLLLHVHALVIGLQQMATPAPVVRRLLDEPALAPLRVEFAAELRRALLDLLRGREAGAR